MFKKVPKKKFVLSTFQVRLKYGQKLTTLSTGQAWISSARDRQQTDDAAPISGRQFSGVSSFPSRSLAIISSYSVLPSSSQSSSADSPPFSSGTTSHASEAASASSGISSFSTVSTSCIAGATTSSISASSTTDTASSPGNTPVTLGPTSTTSSGTGMSSVLPTVPTLPASIIQSNSKPIHCSSEASPSCTVTTAVSSNSSVSPSLSPGTILPVGLSVTALPVSSLPQPRHSSHATGSKASLSPVSSVKYTLSDSPSRHIGNKSPLSTSQTKSFRDLSAPFNSSPSDVAGTSKNLTSPRGTIHCRSFSYCDGNASTPENAKNLSNVSPTIPFFSTSDGIGSSSPYSSNQDNPEVAVSSSPDIIDISPTDTSYSSPQLSSSVTASSSNIVDGPFQCNRCFFSCPDATMFSLHMELCRQFNPTDPKPFKCPKCPYAAKSQSAFNYHQKTHLGIKPFACRFCNYRTILKRSLIVHLRTHTQEKPYACPLCSYRANQKSNLDTHMNRHLPRRHR